MRMGKPDALLGKPVDIWSYTGHSAAKGTH
jgi:hypothetical protein